ncbi:hypothetical protein SDC9_186035 [bioreactor metagenome]|uniref:Uncharacterized protein n=1 Tax=bioreactor metagenome TaxID=1076179 RepID=A0A645HHK9_9ZZZZ
MRDRPPGVEQLVPAPLRQLVVAVGNPHHRCGGGHRDALRAFDQAVAGDQVGERGALLDRHLHHRAQLLVEQHPQRIAGTAVAPAVEADVEAQVRGERHLAQRGEHAAIGTVVIGADQAFGAQLAECSGQLHQQLRIVQIRGDVAELVGHLSQHRSGQTVLTRAQIDQDQG